MTIRPRQALRRRRRRTPAGPTGRESPSRPRRACGCCRHASSGRADLGRVEQSASVCLGSALETTIRASISSPSPRRRPRGAAPSCGWPTTSAPCDLSAERPRRRRQRLGQSVRARRGRSGAPGRSSIVEAESHRNLSAVPADQAPWRCSECPAPRARRAQLRSRRLSPRIRDGHGQAPQRLSPRLAEAPQGVPSARPVDGVRERRSASCPAARRLDAGQEPDQGADLRSKASSLGVVRPPRQQLRRVRAGSRHNVSAEPSADGANDAHVGLDRSKPVRAEPEVSITSARSRPRVCAARRRTPGATSSVASMPPARSRRSSTSVRSPAFARYAASPGRCGRRRR